MKVTMSDVAKESQMSRPTLYSHYANIEAILAALVDLHIARNTALSLPVLSGKKRLKQNLQAIFKIWIVDPFAAVIDSENARSVLSSCAEYAPVALDRLYGEFEHHLLKILKAETVKKSDLSASDLAQIMTLATRGFKETAEDVASLKKLVDGLIRMTVAVMRK